MILRMKYGFIKTPQSEEICSARIVLDSVNKILCHITTKDRWTRHRNSHFLKKELYKNEKCAWSQLVSSPFAVFQEIPTTGFSFFNFVSFSFSVFPFHSGDEELSPRVWNDWWSNGRADANLRLAISVEQVATKNHLFVCFHQHGKLTLTPLHSHSTLL